VEGIYRAAGPTLSASVADGKVTLTWTTVPGAYAYILYRADNPAGPFTALVSGILDAVWLDEPGVSANFSFRVTGIEPNFGETEVSNVVEVTV
jgi:hypothetical protein